MIGQLTGEPKQLTSDSIIINVNGVGYLIFTPPTLQAKIIKEKSITTLFTHTHVKEDALDLYGFSSLEDLKLFKLLINISGIGPKIAITLIDKGVEAITTAVSKADIDFFTSVKRLGKKNAQKIIIELKPKLGDLNELDLLGESPETKEAIDALTGLGFNKNKVNLALKEVSKEGDSVEEKIKKAIKYLGQK